MGVDVVSESIVFQQMRDEGPADPMAGVLHAEAAYTQVCNAFTNEPPIYGTLENGHVINEHRSWSIPKIDGIDDSKKYHVYEFQRSPGVNGSLDARVNRLLVVKNDDQSIAGFLFTEHDASIRWIRDSSEALRAIGIVVEERWKDDDISHYIDELNNPQSDTRKLTNGLYDKYYCVPFETGFSLFQLYKGATEVEKEPIARAALERNQNELVAYSFLDSPELIGKVHQIFEKNPDILNAFINDTYAVAANIEELQLANKHEGVDIFPIQQYLAGRLRSVFQAAIRLEGDPDFSWELPYYSLAAMQEIVYEFCRLNPTNVTQTLDTREFGKLETLFLAHTGDSAWHDVLKGYLDARWFMKLIEDTPGEMAKKSSVFYAALGSELYAQRSETTGDKARQLALTKSAIEQLVEKGKLPHGYSLLDAGSGPMEFLAALEASLDSQHKPRAVVAVDRDPYVVPSQLARHVIFEQADMTSPEYLAAHQGEFDVALHMWSPLDDNEAVLQKEFLDSINKKLKNGGFALIELPIAYVKEMLEEMKQSGRRTRGRIVKAFTGPGGEAVEKPFEILSLMPLWDRAKDSGFTPINQGNSSDVITIPLVYVTSSGQERAFAVFQKIGDPVSSFDQMVYGLFDARREVPVQ